jgi:replicative DNA helicase
LNQLKKYDPDNDFTASLFAGLRCPNGTISIIGARPGGGKTSAMINTARETLTNTNRAAFFVNLEMNSRQILTNLCLSIMYADATPEQRVELQKIEKTISEFNRSFKWKEGSKYPKNPIFAELQLKAMQKVEAALNEKRLFIYDGIGNKPEGITADIAAHAKEGDIVLLDYMQRTLPPSGQESQMRQVQVQLASRAFLNAAIESQCVIIAGAQFNRDGEKDGKEATLAGFRESGDIEQDAHNAIAIEKEKDTETRYVHVIKEREGGSRYERMELEIVKNYVYWTEGLKYELPAAPPKQPRSGSKAQTVKGNTNGSDILTVQADLQNSSKTKRECKYE